MNGHIKAWPGSRKVVVITGGNTGVGFALAQRLLTLEITLTICLACRNVTKAGKAKAKLEQEYKGATIDVLQIDTSSTASVTEAAKELQKRYTQINYLYLNAGIMPQTSIDWNYVLWLVFHPSYMLDAFGTGEGLIRMEDTYTDTTDGLRLIFTTNLFGHFLLVKELENLLCDSSCHIIWTSSSNSNRKYFDMKDIQHKNGTQPYSSAKYGINLLSIALNERLQDKGVHSHVISPGFALTGMTSPILQNWFWFLLYPIIILMRIVIPTMCLTAWNSAEALVWLFQSDPKEVSPSQLYTSTTSVFGHNHVVAKKIDCKPHEPMLLYQKLEELQQELGGKVQVHQDGNL